MKTEAREVLTVEQVTAWLDEIAPEGLWMTWDFERLGARLFEWWESTTEREARHAN